MGDECSLYSLNLPRRDLCGDEGSGCCGVWREGAGELAREISWTPLSAAGEVAAETAASRPAPGASSSVGGHA